MRKSWIKHLLSSILALGALGTLGLCIVAYKKYSATIAEQIEHRYTSDIEELLKPHNEADFTYAVADNLLKDLDEVINIKSQQDAEKRKKLRNNFADNLAKQFQDNSIDFEHSGNLQLDLLAMSKWEEYPELLQKNSKANINIIYRYRIALKSLAKRDPEFIKSAAFRKDNSIEAKIPPKDGNDGTLLRDLTAGYGKHTELLRPNEDDYAQSFCWYYSATDSQLLTNKIFHYDQYQFAEEVKKCKAK